VESEKQEGGRPEVAAASEMSAGLDSEPKPVLYHYCVMRQLSPGSLQYFHGSSERYLPLETNADYNDFSERLASSIGCEKTEITILSITRL
jgi:hypothetical protein